MPRVHTKLICLLDAGSVQARCRISPNIRQRIWRGHNQGGLLNWAPFICGDAGYRYNSLSHAASEGTKNSTLLSLALAAFFSSQVFIVIARCEVGKMISFQDAMKFFHEANAY